MDGEKTKINSFTDLNVWQRGHELVLLIYKITKHFPKEEIYGLVDQMRRCVVSITSNIAEGFSRQSYKDKTHFYSMSLGSLTELQNQLIISKDLGYLTKDDFDEAMALALIEHKLLNGIIKSSKRF
jgi:four helix bundle protein